MRASASNLSATTWSTGSSRRTCLALASASQLGRQFDLVGFQQRLADLLALRLQEGVGHAAADDERVHLGQQVADDADLVADLGAAQNRQERLGWGFSVALPRYSSSFSISSPAALFSHEVRDALGAGVGAVRRAEGVVDVDIAELGQLLGERRIVLLLFGVVAHVFQQQGLSALQLGWPSPRPACRRSRARSRRSGRGPCTRPAGCAAARPPASGCSLGSGLPLGRPRCETRISLAPWRSAYSMVGSVSRMRVSSVTRPSSSGTLKSTRIKTRLPCSVADRGSKAWTWQCLT